MKLIMPFSDESESFCAGFEAGEIWSILSRGDHIERRAIHSCNRELVERMCVHWKKRAIICDSGIEGWDWFETTHALMIAQAEA